MSKDKDPEANGPDATNVTTAPNGKLGFEMKIYPKPSAKEVAAARPCRVFIVFTFVLFLVGFLIASIALLAITEKCNKRDKPEALLSSNMQYQITVREFFDSDNDTNGDLNGITAKLPYIKSLGADSILLTDVIRSIESGLSSDLGTEGDLRNLVAQAKESGLSVFLQVNVFTTLTSGRWFSECSKNIANCQTFVVRESEDTNEWKNTDGGSAWHGFDVTAMKDGEEKDYMYYSYYNSAQPKLNMRNDNVLTMVADRLKWWLSFGVAGFLATDASRLIVESDADASKQLDQDHPHTFHVLNQLYDFIHSQDAQLWVLPSTPVLAITPYYLGTPSHPQADLIVSDTLAYEETIDITTLNHTISSLIASPLATSRLGWLMGGPKYSRIASRLSTEGEARLLSLLLLVLPGHVLPYYGDERMFKDQYTQDTARMVFSDAVPDQVDIALDKRGSTAGNDVISSAQDMVQGFRSLARLRSKKNVLTGTPKVVYAAGGVLVLQYSTNHEQSSLVSMNFNSFERTVRHVQGCGRYAKVLFTVSPVDLMVDCSEVRLPAYGMLVTNVVY